MIKPWLIIGLAGFLLAGCADSTSDNEKETDTSAPEVVNKESAVPVTGQDQINISAPTARLNPAHGEPGHDCAIAVGAPLDGSGPPDKPISLPTVTQPTAQPSIQGTAPTGGLNPAHGQPGHDCAVAVGAPLPAK